MCGSSGRPMALSPGVEADGLEKLKQVGDLHLAQFKNIFAAKVESQALAFQAGPGAGRAEAASAPLCRAQAIGAGTFRRIAGKGPGLGFAQGEFAARAMQAVGKKRFLAAATDQDLAVALVQGQGDAVGDALALAGSTSTASIWTAIWWRLLRSRGGTSSR